MTLRKDARSVGQIASDQPVSRLAVSQHLTVLQDAGLINVDTEGKRRFYSERRQICFCMNGEAAMSTVLSQGQVATCKKLIMKTLSTTGKL